MLVEYSSQGGLVRREGASHHTDLVEMISVGFHQRQDLLADQRQFIVAPGGISHLNREVRCAGFGGIIAGRQSRSFVGTSGEWIQRALQKLSCKAVGRLFAEREIDRDRETGAQGLQEGQLGLRQVV